MKVHFSWIREFVDVTDSADAVGRRLSQRGLALEGLEPWPDGGGDDAVLDFDVTANRPDCLSIVGIAREIATVYDLPLRINDSDGERQTTGVKLSAPPVPVTIDEPDLCARYAAAVAEVEVGSSPDWMQARLSACGVRPISNIVDITNYVLLELGHPMHAFDLDRLAGPAIRVRRARSGEILKTLDGETRTLTPETLVIADAENAQAVGGVMGGADSEVHDGTRRIVFESAWFNPASIRTTSKRLGLRTEASIRFERGADLTIPARALARACELLIQIGAGRAWGHVEDVYPRPHRSTDVVLERRHIKGVLGMEVPDASVERILGALGFASVEESKGWRVTVPGWRVDIHRGVDLVEEVGRHHGFEHLPTTFPAVQEAPADSDPRIARDRRVRGALLGTGFSEAITFAFIEESAAEPFLGGQAAVTLANPLSEKFAVMRPSLLPGLIDAVSHNRRHGQRDVRLFEIGTRFSPSGESRGAAMAWTGLATADHWSGARRDATFFDIKGVVEQLVAMAGTTPAFLAIETPFLISGRAASLVVDGEAIGVLGQLAPERAQARQLPPADAVYVAEVDLDALTRLTPSDTIRSTPLPRFPSVVRDVSILVDDALSAETVRGTIRAAAPATLVGVREFDRYQGKGIADGKVSLSLRLTFQSLDRTLTDGEVQSAMDGIVTSLTKELGAVQR
ncbi:MAG: phenylalanine--tRNA ligase subunit beta [Vicinamibacterales bacterium]